MRQHPYQKPPGDKWSRTLQIYYSLIHPGATIGAWSANRRNINRQFITGAVILAVLISLIVWFSIRDEANLQEIELLQDVFVTNQTDESVSVWVRRDENQPPATGTSIAAHRAIECPPPQCGLPRGSTEFWRVSRESDDETPPFAVTAWSSRTGEILFAEQHTLSEMQANEWRLTIVDQR